MAVLPAAEVLEWALEIERNGEAFYNAVIAKSTDPEIKAVFKDLAIQEEAHAQAFQRMLGALPARGVSSFDYDEYQAYLQAVLSSALFAGPDKALTLAEEAQNREAALRAAIGFEKDTLLFFYDLRDMVREVEREIISDIIREEKTHLRRLAGML